MVPSWGYQLFISGYKLMAYGRFFFFLHEIVMNVKICYSMFKSSWDLALVTFRTPMVTSWKVTAWGYQSVFKVFQGPIFFALLIQFLGSPESYGELPQKVPKMACSIMFRQLVISSLHPVQSVPQLSFSKIACIPPKEKGFMKAREIFSQYLHLMIVSRLFTVLLRTLLHVLY